LDTLRVALIGYGLAGATFHAPVIAATPGLRLTSIVTSNSERAAAARARHPGVEIVPTAEELWARADRHEVVVIAAHNRAHVPLGLAAIAAGLPVVIDKPVAPSSDGARRLEAAARAAGVASCQSVDARRCDRRGAERAAHDCRPGHCRRARRSAGGV
jgi:predicted dehydrogenase